MSSLHKRISNCELCKAHLPQPPRPVIQFSKHARIIVIGQAPGRVAHDSNTPWDDKSGDRLRSWLAVDRATFYDPGKIALVPMGFCFPGTGKSGDLPPRKECAPTWHPEIFRTMTENPLKLLVGRYSQDYYLKDKRSIMQRCKNWRDYVETAASQRCLVFPHPSPRNNIWLKKNLWFETEVIPEYKKLIAKRLITVSYDYPKIR